MNLLDFKFFLEKLAEKSETVYWLSSPNFDRILYISPAYEKIWGRPRSVLYENPALWASYLVNDGAIEYHPIQGMAEKLKELGQNARYEENYRIMRPDGDIRWIVDRGFPIYEGDECLGVTGVATDITQIQLAIIQEKKAEEEKKAKELELVAAQERLASMQHLAHAIAHELRTPLISIDMGINALRKTFPTLLDAYQQGVEVDAVSAKIPKQQFAALQKVLPHMQTETDSALLVIDLLLANVQSSVERLIQPNTCFSLKEAVEMALDRYPFKESQRDSLHWCCTTDLQLHGSQELAIYVLFNLLRNALYFIEKAGKGEIFIDLFEKEDACVLHFKDTGFGISMDDLPQIFEQFFTKNTHHGSGIGLAFCKKVVESLGGAISCEGRKNEYTLFTMTFPKNLL